MTRIACFGELLCRLSPPGRTLLRTATSLDLHVGGAEANVAIGLASLGHSTSMIGLIPDDGLGDTALAALRGAGVNCEGLRREPGRMGLYFLTPGASLRSSEIVYDRANSVFACAAPESWDWDALLDGMDWLHLSGITPALGAGPAQAAITAAKAAHAKGMKVIFDGNYRARLWEAWDSDPRTTLTELVSQADVLFGNHRDISLLLGQTFSGDGPERRRDAALAAFKTFPNLSMIASTARHLIDADHHRLAARLDTPTQHVQTEELSITGIIDRIGGGDAFATGVLHGLLSAAPDDLENIARSGLAVAALKHSLPGDASLFGIKDLMAFMEGSLDVRR
ncbi:sugar kinase [Novosphingobium sp. 9]|uniref:sugar kinase n=1 Tax=Novosphingobium sp. 9 TaxID=2025349 RepID=UPI0021B66F91|nr:sugar kinase [Novosphingobium sp. 9]